MTSKLAGLSAFLAVSMAMVILSRPNSLAAGRTKSALRMTAAFIATLDRRTLGPGSVYWVYGTTHPEPVATKPTGRTAV